MPGPSRHNRRLKKKNDRRSRARSAGGRTPSEAGLARSMAAQGNAVSRSNQRVGSGYRAPGLSAPVVSAAQSRQIRERKREQEAKRNIESVRNRISQSRKAADSRPKSKSPNAPDGIDGLNTRIKIDPGGKIARMSSPRKRIKGRIKTRAARINKLQRQKQRTTPNLRKPKFTRPALGLPKPFAPRGKSKKQRRQIQRQIKQQRQQNKADKQRLAELNDRGRQAVNNELFAGMTRVTLPTSQKPFRGPKTPAQQERWRKRAVSQFLANTGTARALRREGVLPQVKVPTRKQGGKTVAQARAAIKEAKAEGRAPRLKDITVARGEWKKVGGYPKIKKGKYKGLPNPKYLNRVYKKILPPVDRRAPIADEIANNPKKNERFWIEYSRASYEDARAKGLPIGNNRLNPWARSDARAPENETKAQRARRERRVLYRLIGDEDRGPVLTKLDPYGHIDRLDATAQQRRRDTGDSELLNTLLDPKAFERVIKGAWKNELLGPTLGNIDLNPFSDPDVREASTGDQLSVAMTLTGLKVAGLALRKPGQWTAETIARKSAPKFADEKFPAWAASKEVLSETLPGRVYKHTWGKVPVKVQKNILYGVRGSAAVGLAVDQATGQYAEPVIEGMVTQNPSKAIPSTLRAVLGMITGPAAIAANIGLSARRAVGSVGEDNPYLSSTEYIWSPVARLAQESWREIEQLADVMTSRDADRIREVAESDFGYIYLISGAWTARAFTKGMGTDVKEWGSELVGDYARQVAYSPAGQAAAAQLRRLKDTRAGDKTAGLSKEFVEYYQTRRRQNEAEKRQRGTSKGAMVVQGRAAGQEEWDATTAYNAIARPKQRLLTYDWLNGGAVKRKVENWNDELAAAYGERNERPRPYMDVEDALGAFLELGIDPRGRSIAATKAKFEAALPTYEPNTFMHRATRMALAVPEMWDPSTKVGKKFGDMIDGAYRNDARRLAERINRQQGTEAGRRQMRSDREIQSAATLDAAARVAGLDRSPTARERLEEELAEEQALLDAADAEYRITERTVRQLKQERKENEAVLRVLVEQERGRARAQRQGAAVEQDLTTAEERLLRTRIARIDAQNQLRDIPRQRKQLRDRIKKFVKVAEDSTAPSSGRNSAYVRERLEELKDLDVEVDVLKSIITEARSAEARVRELQGKVEAMVKKPDPRLKAAREKRQELGDKLAEARTAREYWFAMKVRLSRDLNGTLTQKERDAIIARYDSVLQAALLRKGNTTTHLGIVEDGLITRQREFDLLTSVRNIVRLGPEGIENFRRLLEGGEEFLMRMKSSTAQGYQVVKVETGKPVYVRGDKRGVSYEEARRLSDSLQADTEIRPVWAGERTEFITPDDPESGAASYGMFVQRPEEYSQFLKEEYGLDITPGEIRRSALEQLENITAFVENGRAIQALMDELISDGRPTTKVLLEIQRRRNDLELEQAPLADSRDWMLAKLSREQRQAEIDTNPLVQAAFQRAEAENVRARKDAKLQILQDEHALEAAQAAVRADINPPPFISRTEEPDSRVPVDPNDENPQGSLDEQRSEEVIRRKGTVDRSQNALMASDQQEIRRNSNRRRYRWLAENAVYSVMREDGSVWTRVAESEKGEFERLYREQTGSDIGDEAYVMDARRLDDADATGELLNLAGRYRTQPQGKDYQKLIDDLDQKTQFTEVGNVHVVDDLFDPAVVRRAEDIERKEGERFVVYVNRGALDLFRKQDADLNGAERFFFQVNRAASRLVLGTSVSWMFAQVFAELGVLAAQHPGRMWKALSEAWDIREEGGPGARTVAAIAQSSPGANPAVSRRTRLTANAEQRAFVDSLDAIKRWSGFHSFLTAAVKLTRTSYRKSVIEKPISMQRGTGKQFVADVATLRMPGIFDRFKSGIIREAGVLAELDSQLSLFRRQAKAVKGQFDLIEKYADKLSRMTRKEQLAWLDSDEGYMVGLELAKRIDDQLGNWQDLRPGLEQHVGQLVFFYPFVRFSLNWAFRTYPRDHPVLWTLATTMGVTNAEMLEELIDYDPAWPNEWITVPVFGNPAEGSRPTTMLSVSRLNPSGNVLTELGIQGGDPVQNAVRTLVPLYSIVGRSAFGLDPYFQGIQDGNEGAPSGWAKLGAALDEIFAMTPFYREYQRQTGFTAQGALDRNASNTEYVNPVGKDEGTWPFLRRNVAPFLIPEHTHLIQDKQQYNELKGRSLEIFNAKNREYLYKGRKNVMLRGPNGTKRLVPFSRAGEYLTTMRKYFRKEGIGAGRTPREQSMMDKWNEIADENKFTNQREEKINRKLRTFFYDRGLLLDPDSPEAKEKTVDQDNAALARWKEWQETYPFEAYPRTEDEARRLLKAAEAKGVRFTRPNDAKVAPDFEDNPKPAEGGQQLTNRLRENTRKRLEAKGMRRVSLADPKLDPETRVNKKGEVTRYRGIKVAGNVTLAEVAAAEEANALDVDGKADLLRTPRIQKIQDNQRQVKQKLRVAKRKAAHMGRVNGGMPSNVPKEYAKWIRKYAPRLDKQARETYGLSGVVFMAKMLQGESGFDMSKVGPDTPYGNARGAAQFIPPTRDAFVEQFGIDPWRSAKEAVQAMALHLDGKSYSKTFGIQGYNPGINDSYYLDQDVGEIVEGKPVDKEALQAQRKRVKELEEQLKLANKDAKGAGLPLERVLAKPTLWAQPKKPKGGKPSLEWLNGTAPDTVNPDIVRLAFTISKMTGQDLQITSALRPGDTDSNHSEGGALDISAMADGGEGEKRGDAIAYAAVIAAGGTKEDAKALASGAAPIVQFTSPNGHTMEMLWKGDGDHRDHVHIAVESGGDRGQRVFRGRRVIGAGVLRNGVTSTGSYTGGGGGGSAGGTSGSGSVMADYDDPLEEWVGMDLGPVEYGGGGMSYEEGGVDPAVVQAAEVSAESGSGDSVKSAAEQLASLPKVQKKKKVPRFDPSNRI